MSSPAFAELNAVCDFPLPLPDYPITCGNGKWEVDRSAPCPRALDAEHKCRGDARAGPSRRPEAATIFPVIFFCSTPPEASSAPTAILNRRRAQMLSRLARSFCGPPEAWPLQHRARRHAGGVGGRARDEAVGGRYDAAGPSIGVHARLSMCVIVLNCCA